jgi:hypothetical protein
VAATSVPLALRVVRNEQRASVKMPITRGTGRFSEEEQK